MSKEVEFDENGIAVYDEEEVASFIAKETGLALNIVKQVLDTEFLYMEKMGMFTDTPEDENE